MRVQIDSKKLIGVLKRTSKIFDNKASLPFMSRYKIEVSESSITFIAMNNQCAVSEIISDVVADVSFSFSVEKSVFLPMALKSEGEVLFVYDEQKKQLTIRGDGYKFVVPCVEVGYFEDLKYPAEMDVFSVRGRSMNDALKAAMENVDKDQESLRPVMRQILIELYKNRIIVVGSDGVTLSAYSIDAESNNEKVVQMLVSPEFYTILNPYLGEYDGIVKFGYDSSRIYAYVGNTYLYALTTEDRYLGYARIVSGYNEEKVIEVSKSNLNRALTKIDTGSGLADLKTENGDLSISETQLDSKAWYKIPCTATSDIDIRINRKRMKSVIQLLENEDIKMVYDEQRKYIAIKEETENIKKVLIIMTYA